MKGLRKRIVSSKTVRVYSTEDERIGKVASQLFAEESKFYAEQRRTKRIKTWENFQEILRKELALNKQEEVINCD